jgi:hypothetical protein
VSLPYVVPPTPSITSLPKKIPLQALNLLDFSAIAVKCRETALLKLHSLNVLSAVAQRTSNGTYCDSTT